MKEGGRDEGGKKGGRQGGTETNIWYHLGAVLFASTQKRNLEEKKGRKEQRRREDGWMEGQTDGRRGGIWRARKLIIQLVCWVVRGEEVVRVTKGQPPLYPLPIYSFLLRSDVSSL